MPLYIRVCHTLEKNNIIFICFYVYFWDVYTQLYSKGKKIFIITFYLMVRPNYIFGVIELKLFFFMKLTRIKEYISKYLKDFRFCYPSNPDSSFRLPFVTTRTGFHYSRVPLLCTMHLGSQWPCSDFIYSFALWLNSYSPLMLPLFYNDTYSRAWDSRDEISWTDLL